MPKLKRPKAKLPGLKKRKKKTTMREDGKEKEPKKSSKVNVKVNFKITMVGCRDLPKKVRNRFVYINYKRGKKPENHGETRYIICNKTQQVTWNETIDITSTVIRDTKTDTWKTKEKNVVFHVKLAPDTLAQKETKEEKAARKRGKKAADGAAASSVADGAAKEKKVSKGKARSLKKGHEELASFFINLMDYVKDGTNKREDLAITSGKSPTSFTVRVETQWLKFGKKILHRKDTPSKSKSKSKSKGKGKGKGKKNEKDRAAGATASSSSSSSVVAGATGTDAAAVIGAISIGDSSGSEAASDTASRGGKAMVIDGVEYGLETDLNSDSYDDPTTMPTMTATQQSDDTSEDFSDEEEDPMERFVNFPRARAISHSEPGTSSEMGSRPTRKKTRAPTSLGQAGRSSSDPRLPQPQQMQKASVPKFEKPTMSKQQLHDLSDALHYAVFMPVTSLFDLEHSPQDLLELLRSAFGMSQEIQDALMERVLTTCNYEHVLCQLLMQLAMVKRDEHSFYKKGNFQTSEMFARWKALETVRIERLIGIIRDRNEGIQAADPLALKSAPPYMRFPDVDFHVLFRLLLRILFHFDRFVNDDLLSNRDMSVLSQKSIWLLKEFGERYQVNVLFRTLSIMDLLIGQWEPTLPHLYLLQINLMKLHRSLKAKAGESASVISKQEFLFMRNIFENLDDTVGDSLSGFYLLGENFDHTSPLKLVLGILQEYITLEALVGLPERTYHDVLFDHISSGISCLYDKLLSDAQASLPSSSASSFSSASSSSSSSSSSAAATSSSDNNNNITPTQLGVAVDLIGVQLANLVAYKDLLEFDVVTKAARGFSKWFFEDLQGCCSNSEASAREVIVFGAKAKAAADLFSQHIPNWTPPVPLAEVFRPWVKAFLDETKMKQEAWLKKAIEEDRFTAEKGGSHSSSVVDLLSFVAAPTKFLKKADFLGDTEESLMLGYGRLVINGTFRAYAQSIYQSLVVALCGAKDAKKVLTHFPAETLSQVILRGSNSEEEKRAQMALIDKSVSADAVIVTEGICIRLNDIEAALIKLKSFRSTYESEFGRSLEDCVSWMERMLQSSVAVASLILNHSSNKIVKNVIRKSPKVDVLTRHLDTQLLPMSEFFSDTLFQHIIEHLWTLLLQDIFLSLQTHLKDKYIERAHSVLAPLTDYFHADGQGLSKQHMNATRAQLISHLEKLLASKAKNKK